MPGAKVESEVPTSRSQYPISGATAWTIRFAGKIVIGRTKSSLSAAPPIQINKSIAEYAVGYGFHEFDFSMGAKAPSSSLLHEWLYQKPYYKDESVIARNTSALLPDNIIRHLSCIFYPYECRWFNITTGSDSASEVDVPNSSHEMDVADTALPAATGEPPAAKVLPSVSRMRLEHTMKSLPARRRLGFGRIRVERSLIGTFGMYNSPLGALILGQTVPMKVPTAILEVLDAPAIRDHLVMSPVANASPNLIAPISLNPPIGPNMPQIRKCLPGSGMEGRIGDHMARRLDGCGSERDEDD
ncbi:hypothetical protein K469DRAFT_694086 [Zopfia rhizophila CBS 207.26]|uniref:Uncharacterized protein n=1 Tax=Zopfia rhizophila CBS 207.26 TaxID=1314779 RepID=A0A6A6DN68_9PEZI|nr:hypothetical protein K469DRAFT_694086 [Zopfia rhizophila CBS 207.26]